MDNGLLRRKDTTKGPPLRILSLDGGGVRGYSMLIILQELMHRVFVEIEGRAPKRNEIPKPCDHFDLIVGTGTGGLIAIMLGRLRMDVETCKDVYVRMTRRVFETDKTFAGIPYRSTLFKASKLEDAIRDCVREHTVFDDEGNDNLDTILGDIGSPRPSGSVYSGPQRSASTASRYSQIGTSPITTFRGPLGNGRWGNVNALLYDSRENRTKTAVTAVYRGTPLKNGGSIFLRSYDSRKEPAPEKACTIWQAGRATCATALAFKPIQIGQSLFLDEGAGKYNPSPQTLDEAVCNEWPGREVGVFISIGTGKRPGGTSHQQHEWWEGFVSGGMGDFAEARRRLISKIEGCEETHKYMLREHLSKRGVNPENYFRLNVEVGVGEFGMNEWARLSEISTNTRMYLAKQEVQLMNMNAAQRMGKIHFAKLRWLRQQEGIPEPANRWDRPIPNAPIPPPSVPMAIELPAEDVTYPMQQQQRPSSSYLAPQQYTAVSDGDKFSVVSSDEYPQPVGPPEFPPRHSGDLPSPYRRSGELHSSNTSPRRSGEESRHTPPPLPPKTPIPPAGSMLNSPPRRPQPGGFLPYPDTDGPPPVVNMARKPEFGVK